MGGYIVTRALLEEAYKIRHCTTGIMTQVDRRPNALLNKDFD